MHLRVPLYLLAIYVLAVLLPGPSLWLNSLTLGGVTCSKLLLSGLLFFAGAALPRISEPKQFFSRSILVGLGVAWAIPLLSAICVIFFATLLFPGISREIPIAIVLIASMPVANSSIAWSQMQRGSVLTSTSLLGFSTLAAPLLVPLAVATAGFVFPNAIPAGTFTAWQTEMSLFLIGWVFGPLLLGYFTTRRLSQSWQQIAVKLSKKVSLPILLILNYLNAAPAMPSLFDDATAILPIVSAVTMQLVISCCLFMLATQFRAANSQWNRTDWTTSVMNAVLLKNTGAALVFAGIALPHMPLLSLTIIATTLGQHVFVSLRMFVSEVEPASNSPKILSPEGLR